MTRSKTSLFLVSAAALTLAACSGGAGPGEIGSKNDIVVRNKNMPGQAQTAKAGDFTSTVEQGAAVPAPAVAAAEPLAPPMQSQPLPDNSPAMKQAVAAHDAAKAVPQNVETPVAGSARADVVQNKPIDAIAPTTPVNAPTPVPPPAASAPVPAPGAASDPAQQYVASQAQRATAPTPVPAPAATAAPAPAPAPEIAASAPNPALKNMPYPLDPNAPFSPKKIMAAQARTGIAPAPAAPNAAPVTANITAPSMNASGESVIRSVQAALAAKGMYTGPQTGIIDADFLNALTKYQGSNGLPMGGVNEPTLRHLGLVQ